ncbi:TetR/AcrR family transcriptional regulator [Aliamphritea ceti]|uniref:TetR/AcrR family transcriptional regulator n=1 Tax=Aliamphritea ceti TaxID=1524258 RepID=UPI0021C31FD3|nr:TetR/AcrR family transcriptional regulator [Aliamphritea ceti]
MNERKAREFVRREREILDCTLELLAGEHWEALSVDKIARHTGIGKGTVYKHFSCKDDIYACLLHADCEQMHNAFIGFAEDSSLSGLEQMREMLLYAFEFHRDNVAHQHMHVHCKQKSFRERISPEYLQKLDLIDSQLTDAFGLAVCNGIKEGDVNPGMSQEMLVSGMSATFEGAMLTLQEGGSCKHQLLETYAQKTEYINQVVEYMLAAITGRPTRQVEQG